MSRAKPLTGTEDPRHGTDNGYRNLGCRCDRCRAAWRDYFRAWSHRTGRAKPVNIHKAERRLISIAQENHGTETRYRFGCRCAECREAARVGRARRRARAEAS